MNLSQALQLWVDISGVDPSRNSFRLRDLDVRSLHQAIAEALDLDHSEQTGLMLLDFAVTDYIANRSFTAEELLDKADQVAAYLEKCRAMRRFLSSDDMQRMYAGFSGRVLGAVQSYDAASDEVCELIGDRHRLALLRRDALRTLNQLEVHQFLEGAGEQAGTPPTYGKHIYHWNNVQSMLQWMMSTPSGVSVNLINESKDDYNCFFAFAIRNGSRLFVFTDREKEPHPLAKDLYHRPDKILAARSHRHWFPYNLAGMKFNENGDAYIEQSMSTDLVPFQSGLRPIAPISQLDPEQIVWLTLMFDLLVDKFWHQGFKAPALSYTADAIKVASPLLAAAQSANLPAPIQHELVLAPLTLADVATDTHDGANDGFELSDVNLWLEERYKHLVTEDTLNILSSTKDRFVKRLTSSGSLGTLESTSLAAPHRSITERATEVELDRMSPLSFATGQQLDKDRRFIARSNYAKQIQFYAEQEFDDRREEVCQWVSQRILANKENLIPLLQFESLYVSCRELDERHERHRQGRREGTRRQFLERVSLIGESEWRKNDFMHLVGNGAVHIGGAGFKKNARTCLLTGAPSAWRTTLSPETPEDLAWLCNVNVSELPDVLQQWTRIERVGDNYLTDCVDPMEWQCRNPWHELTFFTVLYLSVNGMKSVIRDYGSRHDEIAYPPGYPAPEHGYGHHEDRRDEMD